MKIEYCQKCDRGMKVGEEKAYIKDGQTLCEQCYLRATRQEHIKAATAKYETTPGFFKTIFKMIPASWKTGWRIGFKKAGNLLGCVIIGLGIIIGITIALAEFTTCFEEEVSTGGEKRVVTNSRRQGKRKSLSPEQQLAIIYKKEYLPSEFVEKEYGAGLREDDILVTRFRYLLQNLEKQTIQSKQEIVDITTAGQQVLRYKYGRAVSVLDLMEAMNKMIPSYPFEEAVDYSNLMGIYVETSK